MNISSTYRDPCGHGWKAPDPKKLAEYHAHLQTCRGCERNSYLSAGKGYPSGMCEIGSRLFQSAFTL